MHDQFPSILQSLSTLLGHEEAPRVIDQIVGAVCHGPAGLLPVTLSNGRPLLEDMVITGFTREEEVDFGTIDKIPYLLEEKLSPAPKHPALTYLILKQS